MLALKCKTRINGEQVAMTYPEAKSIADAIQLFAKHIEKQCDGINLLSSKLPLEIKLVPHVG